MLLLINILQFDSLHLFDIPLIETELWEAADELRANSKLTAAEYSMPVLGLIFLRHADNRYQAVLQQVLAKLPMRDGKPLREPRKEDFTGQSAIFLPEQARYHFLATLPQGQNVGQAIDDAMQMIEDQYEILKGALPRGYTHFEPDLLANLLKTFNRPALQAATGDVFGKIYEYFLNKEAQSEVEARHKTWLKLLALQKNLWVNFGSGKAPSA